VTNDDRDESSDHATTIDVSTRAGSAQAVSALPPALTLVAGRYEILNLLVEGGMGSVYRARDRVLDEIVAFKVLRRELGAQPELIERFKREVKLARRVTHPNVARMFDIGEHEGTTFLTMEFIDGESLTHLLERTGPLPVETVSSIANEVCAGLSAAHRAGVVHRDLKPDNVMVGRDRRVMIMDFGIARDPVSSAGTVAGLVVGTPAYMAPEQVEAKGDIDPRADIYSLGVMLFELLTGELPFSGNSAFALAAARLHQPPREVRHFRPGLPVAIEKAVMKCMARDRDQRYANANEVAEALANAAPTLAAGAVPIPSARAAEDSPGHKTVAVLPFKNLGPPEDDYVAEGVTEDLIDTLSMTSGLRVRPRSAVVGFKAGEKDPRELGRELSVQVVVEGSVRRTPTSVRLNVRLVSVEDGFQLWASRFDRPANDLLVMSDETAAAIAKALTVHDAHRGRVPADAIAIDLYLRGKAELHHIWLANAEKAVELLARANERAPDDVAILGAYIRACGRMAFYAGERGEAAGKLGRELADRALRVAPDDAHALLGAGVIRIMNNDWKGVAEVARRAVRRAPSSPEALELAGRMRLEAGQIERALVEIEAALSLEPMLSNCRLDRIRGMALLGNFQRALELLEGDLLHEAGAQTASLLRSRLAIWNQDIAKTLDDKISKDPPTNSRWPYAAAMKTAVVTGNVDSYLPMLEDVPNQRGMTRRAQALFRQLLTELFAYLGKHDKSLFHLQEFVAIGGFDVGWVERCPALDPLRSDMRFVSALNELRGRGVEILRELDA
jgi:serine/threonine-protein kinase